MRITQGTFSYLPDLTDEEITSQLDYALGNGSALSVEFTDDPHPRNNYWDMWGLPMFGLADPAGALREISECREAYPDRYIRVSAYDARRAGRRSRCRSWSTGPPRSRASALTGRRRPTGASVTPSIRTRWTARPEPGTADYEASGR